MRHRDLFATRLNSIIGMTLIKTNMFHETLPRDDLAFNRPRFKYNMTIPVRLSKSL